MPTAAKRLITKLPRHEPPVSTDRPAQAARVARHADFNELAYIDVTTALNSDIGSLLAVLGDALGAVREPAAARVATIASAKHDELVAVFRNWQDRSYKPRRAALSETFADTFKPDGAILTPEARARFAAWIEREELREKRAGSIRALELIPENSHAARSKVQRIIEGLTKRIDAAHAIWTAPLPEPVQAPRTPARKRT